MPGGGVSVRDVDVSSICLSATEGGVELKAQRNETGVPPGLLANRQWVEREDTGQDDRTECMLMFGWQSTGAEIHYRILRFLEETRKTPNPRSVTALKLRSMKRGHREAKADTCVLCSRLGRHRQDIPLKRTPTSIHRLVRPLHSPLTTNPPG